MWAKDVSQAFIYPFLGKERNLYVAVNAILFDHVTS